MKKGPDRLNVDPKDRRELYKKIEEEKIFKDKTRKEQFLFAMAIGFKSNIRIPLKAKDGFFLVKDLRAEDEALINSLALFTNNSVEVLADKEKVFKIAEEYAHAGIRLLVDKIESTEFGSFWKHFERELCEIFDEISFSDK